jgi:hypothetical protein
MLRDSFRPLVLILAAPFVYTQSSTTIASHILWERDFPNFNVSFTDAAVADHHGNLWTISRFKKAERLLCISLTGEILSNTELPQSIKPVFPANVSFFALAVSPSGVVALLIRYMHGGREIDFDGAKFAVVHSDGSLGTVKKVADAGPEYKEFVALSDDHFLALGDQSALVIIRLSSEGNIVWRRTFARNWVLPSGAALDNGSSCVVSPHYGRDLLHLIWIDKLGVVRHREQLAANRSEATSTDGSCTILYGREPGLSHGEFFLTSFDRHFNRVWTTPVFDSAPQGGVYGIAAVVDGYIIMLGTKDGGLFLAKYSSKGQLLWSATDTSREYAHLLIGAGDDFYLIGARPKDRYSLNNSLHIVRVR